MTFRKIEAAVYREYRYDILPVYLCCTLGAMVLHSWCKGAALFWHRFFILFTGKPTFIPFAKARKRIETLFSQLTVKLIPPTDIYHLKLADL